MEAWNNDASTVTIRTLLAKQLVLGLSLTALVAHPALSSADIVVDASAAAHNKPTLDVTASGIPLVQITAPTAGGVSRNQYQTFSVDPQGLILNNSRVVTHTQLGGYVAGNAHLAGGSARIILNEVTSTHPSLMRGFTEIAGPRAELVLVNPNGITCNGCGFINTSRSLLTTGTPVFGADGGLDAYRVTAGTIGIAGAGLDARSVDQVDLLARAVSINAKAWAGAFNVITGANEIRHTNLAVTPLTATQVCPAASP